MHRWREVHGESTVPAALLLACLYGPAGEIHGRRAHPGMLCTLSTSRSSHPVDVRRRCFLGTPQKLALMGFALDAPFSRLLMGLDPEPAHSVLFRGVSQYTSVRVFAWLMAHGGLPAGAVWRVLLAWAGGGTFAAGLATAGQAYHVVGMSERYAVCRGLLRAQYPDAPLWDDAGSSEATIDAPPADGFIGGFPCTSASGLNQHATSADVQRTLDGVDAALEYVRHHRPQFVVLENVTRWLHSPLRWGLDHLTRLLEALPYRWHRCMLCPSKCAAPMARPRLIWVGVLLPAA